MPSSLLQIVNNLFQTCYNKLGGSLHESGLSFNPERHFKLNSCLHGRLSWGLKDHGEWKSHSGLKLTFMHRQCYFSGDFSTYTLKYVNETSHFANNLYFAHNERRFYSDFYSRVKFQFKFTWFRIDISFRIECSIRNEKWNELDRNELQLNPDSCKQI